jgi:glycosyltransferase involved in cell wall biosynthesis
MPAILWKLTQIDIGIASARYRAGIPAMYLERMGWSSSFASRHEAFLFQPYPSIVIFVKAFSDADVDLAKEALALGIPIVLDLCDNVFVSGYSAFDAKATNFRTLASMASAIVVTGEALRDVVKREVGVGARVFIIPDAVEMTNDAAELARCFANCRLQANRRRVKRDLQALGAKVSVNSLARLVAGLCRFSINHMEFAMPSKIRDRKLTKAIFFTLRRLGGFAARRYGISALRLKFIGNMTVLVAERWRSKGLRWVIGRAGKYGSEIASRSSASFFLAIRRSACRLGAAFRKGKKAPTPSAVMKPGTLQTEGKCREILWFGNAGATYARFGLVDLVALREPLIELAKRYHVRLTVVSNAREAFYSIARDWPFKFRYLDWAPGVTEACLRSSDVVVIPNSLDEFSICKSANRALLALHHNVPVVATRTPGLEAMADCLIFDDWAGGIERYITDENLRQLHCQRARVLVAETMSPHRIAMMWADLLNSCLSARGTPGSAGSHSSAVTA